MTTTLQDFNPVHIWFCSTGIPTGIDLIENRDASASEEDYCELEESIPEAWWDLEGEIDTEGRWEWNGKGEPADWNRNSVLRITAFALAAK